MSKVILIMDEPDGCSKCQFCLCGPYYDFCFVCGKRNAIDTTVKKPEWCPLRLLPKREETLGVITEYGIIHAIGWNACLDAIEGRSNNE